MKNFIWRILLYLVLVSAIIFFWWAGSSMKEIYEKAIDSLTASQSYVCLREEPKVENEISESAPKPKSAPAPSVAPNPAPRAVAPTPPPPPVSKIGPWPPSSDETTDEIESIGEFPES